MLDTSRSQAKPLSRLKGVLCALPRRCWLLLLFPAALLCGQFAHHYVEAGERVFAFGIYRFVSNSLSRVTGLVPFSLLEFGVIAIAVLVMAGLVWLVYRLAKSPGGRLRLLGRTGLHLLCVGSVVFFIFMVLCGVNYDRHPFSYYSGLEIRPSTVDELEGLCLALAQQANGLRAAMPEDSNGISRTMQDGYRPVAQKAREVMARMGQQYEVLQGYYPPPKAITFSRFMSRLDLTGIYTPFTMEANVNVDSPEYDLPSTMCHELSHLRGFMREDEANFIAYLACVQSGDQAFAYSGTMLALIHASNQLYRQDAERYWALRDTYSTALMRDLTWNSAYWAQFQDTVVSKVSTAVNDTYLKANRQTDGVKSYGRMVDLLLAHWRRGAPAGEPGGL